MSFLEFPIYNAGPVRCRRMRQTGLGGRNADGRADRARSLRQEPAVFSFVSCCVSHFDFRHIPGGSTFQASVLLLPVLRAVHEIIPEPHDAGPDAHCLQDKNACRNHNYEIQDGFDASRHRNPGVNHPQNDANHDQRQNDVNYQTDSRSGRALDGRHVFTLHP